MCAAIWKRKYEEMLPISCSVMVLLLFLSGLLGILEIGALLVNVLGFILYCFTGLYLIRKKSYDSFIKNFFTPGCLVSFLFLLVTCFFNVGKMAERWDEFSHWMDIVKVMTMFNDFGTCPGTDSTFLHYPPGMALFQYFLQKLYMWNGGNIFSEWRVYVAQQFFLFSFLLPCARFKWKKIWMIVFSTVTIFLCPLLFYNDYYTSVYIDAALGILSGSGFLTVFLTKDKDLFYLLRISLTCAMLVLLKDAGIVFAIILAIVYVADIVFAYDLMDVKRKFFYTIVGIMSVIFPKYLWNFHLFTKNVKSSSSSINARMLFDILLGNDSSYRKQVLVNYYEAFLARELKLGNTGITLNYLTVAIFFLTFLCFLVWYYEKKVRFDQKKGIVLIVGISIQFVVYIIGLCATYISNFSEYEAIRLASFERYINIVYLSSWIVLVFLALQILQDIVEKISYKQILIFSFIVILTIPIENVYRYLSRSSVRHSVSVRLSYTALVTKIMDMVPEKSKVYIISQESEGFDYWVLKFSIRPNYVNNGASWSIGESFYEGDIWTRNISPQEWKMVLMQEYDYVALYKINDYFLQHFSSLFYESDKVEENTLYRINKETGFLEKCE